MQYLKRLVFNLWYFLNPPWDTGESPPELLEFIERNSPGRALDIGCGTGTNVITLAQHGWEAVGVDFAATAIRTARQKARRAGAPAEFHVADATRLQGIEGPFDLIIDMGCAHNLPYAGRQDYLDNLDHLLAPGGTYLLYAFLSDSEEGTGLTEAAIGQIDQRIPLIHRTDGTERAIRPSAWLTFQKLEEQ